MVYRVFTEFISFSSQAGNEQKILLLLLALIFYIFVIPRLSSSEVEFASSPAVKSSEGSTTFFESSRFRFSSDEKSVIFHVSGGSTRMWDLAEPDSSDDGLDYAYLTMRSRLLRTDLSLGRIDVDEGSIEEQLDGIYTRTNVAENTRFHSLQAEPRNLQPV
jgi:hypothetical protein